MVSIIIPSYNNLSQLKNCIKSIQQQVYTAYEVWVIDGNSTDGTKSYLQTLEKPFYFISEPDTGVYDAMNKGVKLSKYPWLYFMGADDSFIDDESLVFFSKYFETNNDLILGKIIYKVKDGVKPFIYNSKKVEMVSKLTVSIWFYNTLHHQGLFYKRHLFVDNMYNTRYNILADYAFNLQLYKQGVKATVVNRFIATCSSSGISKSGIWQIYKEEIQLKVDQSNLILKPFFYGIAFAKYSLRRFLNRKKINTNLSTIIMRKIWVN